MDSNINDNTVEHGELFGKIRSNNPPRSQFDLSYEKKLTCDMGQLIPIMCDEVIPGDVVTLKNEIVARLQPQLAPILHEVNVYVHYFFDPYRLLWTGTSPDNWETFITGGLSGDETPSIPRWTTPTTTKYSLWDYIGFPTGIDPIGAYPLDFPRRAYNHIRNSFYKSQDLQSDVAWTNETILNRGWERDYFTASLPFQQRGTAVALPLVGNVPITGIGKYSTSFPSSSYPVYETDGTASSTYAQAAEITNASSNTLFAIEEDPNNTGYPNVRAMLPAGSSVTISELRQAVQLQKLQERMARSGARYTEFLKSVYGSSPTDERLDRPEYIGGSKGSMIISEVLTTASDGTESTGDMSGHGISVSFSDSVKYRVEEFGLIMGIMSIMPKPAYQDGINRQWLRNTKEDFYFPEFANLSEQAILNAEICAQDSGTGGAEDHNTGIFGYIGRYDEMRIKDNIVCADMRDTYDYWHIGRQFTPASPPSLNSNFIECFSFLPISQY
jgi:hypothetical protein